MLSHSDVIAAFGGVKPLAKAIEVPPSLAIHWGRRGIPARYWPKVEEAAAARDIPVTARALMTLPVVTPPPVARRKASA